jgi:8-oxo-dGTP diphosphatase
MSSCEIPELHVAAGILTDQSRGVLIAQRAKNSHMGGAWEFPGGKLASGETPLQGLVRELREELEIEVEYARFLLVHEHRYPDRHVRLHVWKVLHWSGEPRGVEGQPLQWLQPSELTGAGLLPADQPIVSALETQVPVNNLGWKALAESVAR